MYQQRCAVDIVLTSCNGEKYIQAQVLSIQKCRRYAELVRKLIVVDDASDDSTLEILYGLAHTDARIVVVPNSGARRGVKKNVAFGLSLTAAPCIVLSDQDDLWKPAKLDKLFSALQQAEALHGDTLPLLGFSDLEVVDAELNVLDPSFWHYQTLQPQWARHFRQLLCQNIAPGCSMILNRSLLNKALPFPPAAAMHDWWLLLVAKAFGQVFCVAEPLLLYRQHAHNYVGAQRFRTLVKLGAKGLLQRARANMCAVSAQAQAFHATFGVDCLSSDDATTLLALKDLPARSRQERLWLIVNGTIRKNNFLRNLALIILLCIPPLRDENCIDRS